MNPSSRVPPEYRIGRRLASAQDRIRRSNRLCRLLAVCAALTLLPALLQAQPAGKTLRVAAAADLTPVMPVLAQLYLQKTGVKLIVSTASSGALVTQIENGSPTDIFLGADFTFPEKIVADGLADSKAPTPYAKGSLALITRKDSPLNPLSIERLSETRVHKVAVADPLHAPFGRAATAAITHLRLQQTLASKLVTAENVAQAGQFVESGNAELGFVSLTLAMSAHFRAVTNYVLIPASQYPTIKQYAVILAKGQPAASHQFLDWLLSSEIQAKLPNVGLEPVR